VLLRHPPERLPALGSHADDLHAAVERRRRPRDETVFDQAIHDRGEIAGRNHQALRQLTQHQPDGLAIELRQHVKARHREVEFFAELAPKLGADQRRTGKEAKPYPDLGAVVSVFLGHVLFVDQRELLAGLQSRSPDVLLCSRANRHQ
jgi:hypothetical protein